MLALFNKNSNAGSPGTRGQAAVETGILDLQGFSEVQRIGAISREIGRLDEFGDALSGVAVERKVDPQSGRETTQLHFGNPFKPGEGFVSITTQISPEEAVSVRNQSAWTDEYCDLMMQIAKAYQARAILILEGDTSIGKTFAVDCFTELLYGDGVKCEDIYCNTQMETSDILGKWVPCVSDKTLAPRIKKLLSAPELVGQMESLNSDPALPGARQELSDIALKLGLSANTRWDYQLGALPRAMTMGRDEQGRPKFDVNKPGSGTILHVEEAGLASSGVMNALLQLGGDHGKLAESIRLHGDSGREVSCGEDFWMVISTNLADGAGFLERNKLDPALIKRSVYYLRPAPMSEDSVRTIARKFLSGSLGNYPDNLPLSCKIELRKYPELVHELSEIAGVVHAEFAEMFSQGERGGRTQSIGVNLRDLARLADYVLYFQKQNASGTKVDMAATISQAVRDVYLNRLADPELKAKAEAAVTEMLEGPTGVKRFRGKAVKRAEVLATLVEEISADIPGILPRIQREAGIVDKLRQRRPDGDPVSGVFVEEVVDEASGQRSTLLHIGNPYEQQPDIVTLVSPAPAEDVRMYCQNIVWTPEFCKLLTVAAKAQSTGTMLLIEGDSSTGKTFAIQSLTSLKYGKDQSGNWIRPVDIYLNKHTESSELLGKFVPEIPDGKDAETARRILESSWGRAQVAQIEADLGGITDLSADDKALILRHRLQLLSQSIVPENRAGFKYQPGAIPTSMENGEILHVQELGLARPGVVGTLLQLGGKHGKVARQIQLFSDVGEVIGASPDFWVAMSTNPPENGYNDRNEVDQALVSRVIFHRHVDTLSDKSFQMLARRFFSYSVGNRPEKVSENCHLELYNFPELCRETADVMAEFHKLCLELCRNQRLAGPTGILPPDLRNMALTASYALNFQVYDPANGSINLASTLARAARDNYLNGTGDAMVRSLPLETDPGKMTSLPTEADGKVIQAAYQSVKAVMTTGELKLSAAMEVLFKELMEREAEHNGEKMSQAEKLNRLAREAQASMVRRDEASTARHQDMALGTKELELEKLLGDLEIGDGKL